MHINTLGITDAPAYRALRLRALREHADAFTSSFEEEAERPLADTIQRLSNPAERLWGAFDGPQLVGMVGISHETRLKNRHKAHLVGMYVAPEHAGQGVGAALVAAVVQHAAARQLALLVLTVTDGNHAAQALYERAGFVSFGVEPDAIRVNGVSLGKRHMALQLLTPLKAPHDV
jgi:ribosomal protein S18 acetylase RimI-like enzyme